MLVIDKVKTPKRFNSEISQPKRILVLDDDPIFREVAEPMLRGRGYDVLLMDDGLHDDRFYAKLKIDAAIIDLGLPNIHGLDVIEKLRANDREKKMPIFVATGSTDTDEIRCCYEENGVAFVLGKPVDWGFLFAQLEDAFAEN